MKVRKTKNVEKLRRILTKMKKGRGQIINGKSVIKVEDGEFEVLVPMKLEHTVKLLAGEDYFNIVTVKYKFKHKFKRK